MKSGMTYSKVEELIAYVSARKDTMAGVFEALIQEVVPRIANAYDGAAAETYKTTLKDTSTKMNETIDELITSLKANAEQKQADYQAQDAKMSASVQQGAGTGGAAR